MRDDKICVAFMRDSMYVGGIETYVYKSFIKVAQNGDIPLWITKEYDKVDSSFENFIFSPVMNRCKKREAVKALKAVCSKNGIKQIKIISFNIWDYCKSEKIKKKMNKICETEVSTFLFVPHFKGEWIYLEEGFLRNQNIIPHLGDIYKKLAKNGNIRFFSERHLVEFQNRYGGFGYNFNNVRVPSMLEQVDFNEAHIKRIYNRADFVILSVSRLEFPHKGYILGLVDDFAVLCQKYNNLRLVIVGDGEGRTQLLNKIAQLDSYVRNKISIQGTAEPDALNDYYDDANILVSLAGCFTQGARRGCLSLPARHYTEKCEVYGYLPESKQFTLSEEKGVSVIPFIEDVINMSFDEYLHKCKQCYDTFQYLNGVEQYYDQIKNTSKKTLSLRESLYLQLLFIHNKIRYIFKLCTKKE